jgi:very-short-patch-repair endonuclease
VRADHWSAITSVASEQWGLVASRQVRAAGATPREVDRAVGRGLLVPYRRGVHHVAGAPTSPYQPILAACLAAGPGTGASFLAAAWLWDFGQVRDDHLEVTTAHTPTRDLADVRTHHTTKLLPGDLTERHRVPVTSAARTAVDLAAVLSPYLLARFVDHLRRTRAASYAQLDDHLARLGGRGRSGTRKLRAVLAPRLGRDVDAGDNDAEVKVVAELIRLGVPAPQQQVQVVAGPKVYVLDLAWPDARIAVELDGFDPHGLLRGAFDHDRDRDLRLRRAGWEVIRITTRTDLRLLARYLRDRLATPA